MKKKMRVLFRAICILLIFILLFTSCNKGRGDLEGTTDETPDADGGLPEVFPYTLSDFQIVRPDMPTVTVKESALRLNRTIKEKLGRPLSIRTDFDKSDEKVCEILVGVTTRSASQEILATISNGEYIIQTVRSEDGVKIVLLGATDMLIDKAVSEFEAMIKNDTVEVDGQIKSLSVKVNLPTLFKNYTLKISDPILVAKGAPLSQIGYGPYQFPRLYWAQDGSIYAKWGMSNDKIVDTEYLQGQSTAISSDGGLIWRSGTDGDEIAYTRSLMQNGKYFVGFKGNGTQNVTYLSQYLPLYTANDPSYSSVEYYSVATLKEYDDTILCEEYDPKTGTKTTFETKVNWPHAVVAVYNKTGLSPLSSTLSVQNGVGDLATEDALYFCTYARGLDPKTGEVTRHSKYFSVYVFKSIDNARTWDCISYIPIDSDVMGDISGIEGLFDGFCEPHMEQMPDGSFLMLIRSGHNHPSYLVRSTDGGMTWSKPEKYDDLGVFPQILTTPTGVTLASYGRPGLFLRSTNDPSGLIWNDPIELELSQFGGEVKTCGYTNFLLLNATTVLMIYSDYNYSVSGKRTDVAKCIMVRIITIEPTT